MPNIDWSQLITPEKKFKQAKEAKYNEIASARYEDEISGINWQTYRIPTDRQSRSTMSNAYILLKDGDTRKWKLTTTDGEVVSVPLTKEQFAEIGQAIEEHVQVMFDKESAIRTLIDKATTIEELDAIVWKSEEEEPVEPVVAKTQQVKI